MQPAPPLLSLCTLASCRIEFSIEEVVKMYKLKQKGVAEKLRDTEKKKEINAAKCVKLTVVLAVGATAERQHQ